MGDGVNIAARLEGVARPGAICLSEDAYRQVKSRLDINVSDLGPTALKNIAEPLRVFSVEVGRPGASASRRLAARLARPGRRRGRGAHRHGGRRRVVSHGCQTCSDRCLLSESARAAPFGVPTVVVLPFGNVTGDPQYDPLAQRIGQKTMDATGDRRSGALSAARPPGTAGDPIEAGRQLNADYAVTGNLEAGGDALRVTFQFKTHIRARGSGPRRFRRSSKSPTPRLPKQNRGACDLGCCSRECSTPNTRAFLPSRISRKRPGVASLKAILSDQARHRRAGSRLPKPRRKGTR